MANKAYQFRLYPTKEQEQLLAKTFGCVRFVYNKMLEERIQMFEKFKDDQESLKQQTFPTPAKYKKEFPWLKEVEPCAGKCSTKFAESVSTLLFWPRWISQVQKPQGETVVHHKCGKWQHQAFRWLYQATQTEMDQAQATSGNSCPPYHQVLYDHENQNRKILYFYSHRVRTSTCPKRSANGCGA